MDIEPGNVLLLLSLQRAGLCLRRAIAEPSAVNSMVRSIARESDGVCISRDRNRGSRGTVDRTCPRSAFRMAVRIADSWTTSGGLRVSTRVLCERSTETKGSQRHRTTRRREEGILEYSIFPTHSRQHVFGCSDCRHAAELKALLEH